nr:MAG TPA: hypothetical protein [Microviridae sp.]
MPSTKLTRKHPYVVFSQIMKSTLLPEWESGFSIP